MPEPARVAVDRRRLERRTDSLLAELTLPELRRMIVTTILFVIVLVLFLWMIRTVIIATIMGVIVAVFMRPVYNWLLRRLPSRVTAATLTLLLLIVPIFCLCIYSYTEVAQVAAYASAHQDSIATQVDSAVHHLPFMQKAKTGESVRNYVVIASNYGTNILSGIKSALASIAVAATIFLFTAFYVMVDVETIETYVRSKVAPRYSELQEALAVNVRGVLYGAIYSTVVTQGVKAIVVLLMNLAFRVPLAGVLAVLSFIIGFFPIVGSWSVYIPVAAWLLVFRHAPGQALAMVLIGFFVNTLYISTFLRPKIAAERSKVLNFYWMLVGLVTGVYTFGLVGILLGPMLIGLLKAVLDTITARPTWQLADPNGDGGGQQGV